MATDKSFMFSDILGSIRFVYDTYKEQRESYCLHWLKEKEGTDPSHDVIVESIDKEHELQAEYVHAMHFLLSGQLGLLKGCHQL
ncbi:UNVERIFIED_CONTAM: hypothetical protein NCL1_38145 [Trichonephila clavipes]